MDQTVLPDCQVPEHVMLENTMNHSPPAMENRLPRLGRRTFMRGLCSAAALTATRCWAAGPSGEVDAVEIDWKLKVGSPTLAESGPQLSLIVTPYANLASDYFLLELNHGSWPEFSSGGIQLQSWRGDVISGTVRQSAGNQLSNYGEEITWTTKLTLYSGQLYCRVKNGVSQSWGNFGGIFLSTPTTLQNMNSFSLTAITEFSKIGFAANRVLSLTIPETRSYSSGTEVSKSTTLVSLHQYDGVVEGG